MVYNAGQPSNGDDATLIQPWTSREKKHLPTKHICFRMFADVMEQRRPC
jgi:hypothetical protein